MSWISAAAEPPQGTNPFQTPPTATHPPSLPSWTGTTHPGAAAPAEVSQNPSRPAIAQVIQPSQAVLLGYLSDGRPVFSTAPTPSGGTPSPLPATQQPSQPPLPPKQQPPAEFAMPCLPPAQAPRGAGAPPQPPVGASGAPLATTPAVIRVGGAAVGPPLGVVVGGSNPSTPGSGVLPAAGASLVASMPLSAKPGSHSTNTSGVFTPVVSPGGVSQPSTGAHSPVVGGIAGVGTPTPVVRVGALPPPKAVSIRVGPSPLPSVRVGEKTIVTKAEQEQRVAPTGAAFTPSATPKGDAQTEQQPATEEQSAWASRLVESPVEVGELESASALRAQHAAASASSANAPQLNTPRAATIGGEADSSTC